MNGFCSIEVWILTLDRQRVLTKQNENNNKDNDLGQNMENPNECVKNRWTR